MVVDERNKTLFVCVYQMPMMIIQIHRIIIMIYMIFWGYHIRNNQTKKLVLAPLLCATAKVPIFAVCKNHGTRQRFELCRVPRLQGTRQRPDHIIVLGWRLFFAVGRELHTANPLSCARYIAHGKGRLCRCLVAVCGTRQRVCRGLLGLCCVPGGVSCSGSLGHFSVKRM